MELMCTNPGLSTTILKLRIPYVLTKKFMHNLIVSI